MFLTSNRLKREKVNQVFSTWNDLMYGAPNTSVLEPLGIYLDDLLFFWQVVNIFDFTEDIVIRICDDSLGNALGPAK